MDWLWSVFNWLMVHQPPFPWSLIWFAWTLFLTANFVHGATRKDTKKGSGQLTFSILASFFTLFFIGAIGGAAAGNTYDRAGNVINEGYYWYHWISLLLGWIGVPALLAVVYFSFQAVVRIVRGGASAVGRILRATRAWWSAWRQRRAQEAEAARRARENAPEAVIARCEAAVKEYMNLMTSEPDSAERIREAVSMLERLKRLKRLYQILYTFQQPIPIAADNFDQLVTRADSIFPEVSLQQECREVIQKLREECRPVKPDVQAAIAATEREIEKLVLTIESLPKRAIRQLVVERSEEIDKVADGLRETGVTLPPVTVKPHLEPAPQTVPAPPRRQTA